MPDCPNSRPFSSMPRFPAPGKRGFLILRASHAVLPLTRLYALI